MAWPLQEAAKRLVTPTDVAALTLAPREEELAHDVEVAKLAGHGQASGAVAGRSINVGAEGEELAHDTDKAERAGTDD